MKNIFVLPSDKPSRLWINNLLQGKLELEKEILIGSNTAQNIYITNSESKKIGDYVYDELVKIVLKITNETEVVTAGAKTYHKVILSTDPELIKNGVQAIDDNFLEWFIKNSSCEFVEVELKDGWDIIKAAKVLNSFYKLIVPQPKQETIEGAAQKYALKQPLNKTSHMMGFIAGAKHQSEKMFQYMNEYASYYEMCYSERPMQNPLIPSDWLTQHKQTL